MSSSRKAYELNQNYNIQIDDHSEVVNMCEAIQGLIDDGVVKGIQSTAPVQDGAFHQADCAGDRAFRRRRAETHSEIILIHTLAVS